MSKKLLSVVLSLVMVMSLLTGCGKDDSTFFKEVKEISQRLRWKLKPQEN